MNFSSRCSALALSISFLLSVSLQAIPYKEIANSYLNSFDVIPEQATASSENNNDADKKEKLNFDIKEFNDSEACKKLFELFIQNESNKVENVLAAHLNLNASKDLEVLCGNGTKSASLMAHIDKTETNFGRVALAKIISDPLTNVKVLRDRQAFIQELVEDKNLFAELEHALQTVKRAESRLFSFWEKDKGPLKEAIDKLYFSKVFGRFNKNHNVLEARTRLSNANTAFTLASTPLLFVASSYWGLMLSDFLTKRNDLSLIRAVKDTYVMISDALNPVEYYRAYNSVQEKYIKVDLDNSELSKNIELCVLAGKAGLTALCLHAEYQKINTTTQFVLDAKSTANYLQTRLIGVADIVDSLSVAHEVLAQNEVCRNGLRNYEEIANLFESNSSQELESLITLLQTNTFVDYASFFSVTGRVLAAYKQMDDVKDQLIPALEALGEIDACMSIARLYKENADKDVTYSFVEYSDSNEPYIGLQDFWNPFVPIDTVVVNSIELGHGVDRNMILTGSNTGGKSTALKAISMNMLLAHTIGIVPASKMVVTPMKYIGTSLNISDDTASGTSLFKAEVLRARSLKEVADTLAGNEFAFFAIDELFTGTNAVSGSNAACEFVKALVQNNNLVFAMATHFPQVTQLPIEMPERCTNYKMDVIRHDDGSIEHTFELKHGISDTNIANEIIEEEFSFNKK